MPRQPRLDAPGALHHVKGRSIGRMAIFSNRKDQEKGDGLAVSDELPEVEKYV